MKKKLLLSCLTASIIFCLVSCGENSGYEVTDPSDPTVTDENNASISDATSPPVEPIVQLTEFEKIFQNGPMAAQNENGLWGYIDNSGEYVIQPIYSRANSFAGNGLAIVKDMSSEL